MDENILRSFCCIDTDRLNLCNPYIVGDYTYATDGYIAVRVDKEDKYAIFNGPDMVAKYFAFEEIKEENWQVIDPPDLIERKKTCSACGGTGKVTECTECDGEGEVEWTSPGGYNYATECKKCNGEGTNKGTKNFCNCCEGTGEITKYINFMFGEKLINGKLYLKIMQTQNVEFAINYGNILSEIPFKFDGGRGVLMPLRQLEVD